MNNLNKIYHKGKYRGYEWGKSIGPYLKRQGNKKFRKSKHGFEEENLRILKHKKRASKKPIKVKITFKSYGNRTRSYYNKYRKMRDLNNAVNRPNVIRYMIME